MDALSEFSELGHHGPVPVFGRREVPNLAKRLMRQPHPRGWHKGHSVENDVFRTVACHPAIIGIVRQLIGDDVMLWGTSLVSAPPGHVHPWHSDIETSYAHGKTVSVWIPITGASRNSSLRLMSRTHAIDASVQEMKFLHDKAGVDVDAAEVMAWAKSRNAACGIYAPDVQEGHALFFDGRLWHGSHNTDRVGTRVALLLQYAEPAVPIRMMQSISTPHTLVRGGRPPCIMVSGHDRAGVNNVVDPLDYKAGKMKETRRKARGFLSTAITHLDLPLSEDGKTGWAAYPLARGRTVCTDDMAFHVSVLSPGVTPHNPHSHAEEELLVMLSGEADIVTVPDDILPGEQRHRLRAGSMVYYPAFYTHTIHNTGTEPITYLMFKWRAPIAAGPETRAAVYQFDYKDLSVDNMHEKPYQTRPVFGFPTRHLGRLTAHVTLLQPGAGYAAHRDRYDVAIIVLKGTVETLGEKVRPLGVAYYSAGELHDMRNSGDEPAYYLVFEFHPGPLQRRWLRVGLQLRRILSSPLRQLPHNVGTFLKRIAKRGRRD